MPQKHLPPFDLEVAISTWRQFLSRDRAILPEDLDELEQHLRDEYEAALHGGLPPREAFDRARQGTGNSGDLHASYRRIASEKRYSRAGIGREIRYMASLARSPVASIINIIGLSIAIASVITVFRFLDVYWTLDSFHDRGDRIFLVNSVVEQNGTPELRGTVPAPLGPALEQSVAQVVHAVRVRNASATLTVGDKAMPERVMFAAPSFLDVFSFPLATGSRQALRDPSSVILSSAVAVCTIGFHARSVARMDPAHVLQSA